MAAEITKPILRYHGGKWKLAPWIISHLPAHRVYVEPFAGAASVLLQKPRSYAEVLNDKYGRLVNVFRVLREPSTAARLREMLRLTPYASAEYQLAYEVSACPVEDARRMLLLGWQAHGSVAVCGRRYSGWRRGLRPHGPNSADDWTRLPDQVESWTARLRDVFIECGEAAEVIRSWDAPDTLFYVDPPYVGSERKGGLNGYTHELTDDGHRQLAGMLRGCKGMVAVSGYESELYRELYRGWRTAARRHHIHRGQATTEVLWLSPNIRTELF